MEVLIGFAVGYWVGTRQGREGLEQTVDTLREIWESPRTQRMLGEGLSVALGQKGRRGALLRGVIDEVLERRAGSHETPSARAA